jgi:hypothetical protein
LLARPAGADLRDGGSGYDADLVSDSPIEQLLAALDRLDVDAVMSLLAPDARLLSTDGRRAEGTEAVRELLSGFVSVLRSTTHTITAHWHVDDVWIAEVDASYELQDWLQMTALPRVIILREGPAGIAELRFYGAHELKLSEHSTGEQWGTWIRGRWIPPL